MKGRMEHGGGVVRQGYTQIHKYTLTFTPANAKAPLLVAVPFNTLREQNTFFFFRITEFVMFSCSCQS